MMRTMRFGLVMLSALAALGACEDGTGPRHGDPARIEVVSGSGQQGTVGQPLAQPMQVRVVDDRGRPIPDEVVSFVVTGGGGSVSAGTVTTDDEGIAATGWTLGTSSGAAQTLEARIATGGQTLVSEPVTATSRAAAPARMEAASDTQNMSGAVGGPARDSLAVRVLDALGNPVPGVDVGWTTTGGGTSPARSTTDATGIARTQWTLGPRTDLVQGVTATVPGLSAITFTGRSASRMRSTVPSTIASFTPGAVIPVTVDLAGDAGGPVQGVRVNWTVLSGGGTVSPASSITSGGGEAQAQWTLGPSGGTQTLRATAGPLQQDITVQVISPGTRVLAAQVPGRVLDATADRVLWFDSAGGARLIKIRGIAAGTDVTVKADSETVAPVPLPGFLFSGGAFVSNAAGHWFEWRNGTLTGLGRIHSLSVEGGWAAWGTDAAVVRRDLVAGTTQVIYNAAPSDVDVGPDGDVAFIVPGQALVHRDGAVAFVSPDPTPAGGRVRDIATDGVNVAYVQRYDLDIPAALFLHRPSGADEFLLGSPTQPSVTIHYRLAGGWMAYSSNGARVRRRSPGGTVEQITNEPVNGSNTQFSRVQALAPDGTLVYSDPALGAYVLVTPGGTRYSLGPAAAGERVEWRGDRFLLISGGSVYRLGT